MKAIIREIRDPVIVQVVRYASLTGWRKGEILDLTWDMIDMSRKVLIIPGSHTKNGKPKPWGFAAYPQLAELLHERWEVTRAVQRQTGTIVRYVFTRGEGKPIKSVRGAWDGAVDRAGVGRVRFHDLRVYALHAMEMAGLPRSLSMTLSGHKTESVFTRYSAIFTPKELQDAGAKLAAHHAQSASESPSVVGLRHRIGTIDASDRKVSNL